MNNAKPDVMEEVMRAVECPVCLEKYKSSDTPNKRGEARVLKCSHLVCGSCVSRLQPDGHNRINCPLCRQRIKTRDLPIVKEAAFIAEGLERIGAANAEAKQALQTMQARVDALEEQLRATGITAPAEAAQPIAVVAAPAAPAAAAPAVPAAPAAATAANAAPAATTAAPAATAKKATSSNNEYEYKELKRFTVLKTIVHVEVEWEGDWGDEQTTLEKLENISRPDIVKLIKIEYDKRPTYFTTRVRNQFKNLGYDVFRIGRGT